MVNDERVAGILDQARKAADNHGRRGTRLTDLGESAVSDLVQATLDFLRSRPSSASSIKGWSTITAMQAGVMPWWTGLLGEQNHDVEIKRLRPLRRDVYDYLGDELGLINKAPGQGSSIDVSPQGTDAVALGVVPGTELVTISPGGVGFGTPEQNKRIEIAAMAKVCEHFAGWAATDVSVEKCGWDITFKRGDEVVHAEVKGRSGKNPTILLTANEMAKAHADPFWQLVIVTQALIAPRVTVIARDDVTSGGEPYVYRFTPGHTP